MEPKLVSHPRDDPKWAFDHKHGWLTFEKRPMFRAILIDFIKVHRPYRNQGAATSLLRQLFDYALRHNLTIYPGAFTADGLRYVRPVIARLLRETGVKVVWDEEG
jgi:GNAT superfamily N-acetyltransferase